VLVAICVGVTSLLGLLRMDEVMGLFDWRADQNAAQGYLEREYADGGAVMHREVIEAARRVIPRDGTYRVVIGPNLTNEGRFTRLIVADFLKTFLLPRRQVPEADWVICYGCDRDRLGGPLEVVADAGDGVVLGRVGR
jgi:hypothetical protein